MILCGGLLSAFALRLYHLTYSGFWFDEAASYFIASKGLVGIFEYVRLAPGEHPPIYYWLLYLWIAGAGASEFAMRFFSVWFGVLFIALFYRFARHHFAHPLPLIATMLAVPLPYLADYSQEARMYTLVLCFSVLAMDYFLRWARGERLAAIQYWLCLFVAMSTHYFAILLLIAQDVYVLSRRELWRTIGKPLLILHLALLGALSIWLLSASGATSFLMRVFSNPLFAGHSLEGMGRSAIELTLGAVTFRMMALVEHWLAASAWLIVLIGALWAWRHLDAQAQGLSVRSWLFSLLIVPPLAVAMIPYIFTVRYLFVIIPALLILLACGLLALRSAGRALVVVGLIALLLTFAYGLNLNYQFVKSPYREMAAIFSREARPDDGLIQVGVGQWPLALYYLHGAWQRAYIPQNADAAELVDIDPAMRAMEQAHGRLWVLSQEAYTMDPGNNVPRWLSLNAYPVAQHWFKNSDSVALYLSNRSVSPTPYHNLQFGEWWMLEQASVSTPSATAGDDIAVLLRWHALKKNPQPLQLLVTLRLFDAAGQVVQERVTKPCNGFCPIDDWPVGETIEDRHGLLVPRDLPDGEYSLRLEVFPPRQNQSLPIKGAHGETLGASLELARIQVTNEK